ncbi:MAG TPA: HAD family hydrolase [Acidimicrobiia bacterium]|nr:HAD family hydrolase [Acidimicrobiia bacterium]
MTTRSGRAVLFDIDGTLVDTNYLHAVVWRRVFLDHGHPEITTARIHGLVGMGTDQLLETLLGRPRPDLKSARAKHFDGLKDEIRALPGAADLLRAVHDRGVRVVLATSAEKSDLEALLAAIGADDAIDAVTGASDVDEAKPSPDIFEAALELVGTAPEDTVAVGDTIWDVKAAARAGLPCVALTTGGIHRAELEAAGAVAVYDDPATLLGGLDDSPLLGGTSTESSPRRTE